MKILKNKKVLCLSFWSRIGNPQERSLSLDSLMVFQMPTMPIPTIHFKLTKALSLFQINKFKTKD